MAIRYRDKVRDWSIWNEPELHGTNELGTAFDFNIRTAEIIKRIHPDARIAALSITAPKLDIIEPFLQKLKERNKLDLFTWIIYHHYCKNPDLLYDEVVQAHSVVKQLAPNLKLWQGEAGTQSEYGLAGALKKYPWTELKQAKWITRRMLGDIGHGSISSVFTAADLDYRTTSFHNGLLRYGLIKTAGAADGYRVLKVKIAYYAVQNVVSVFNDAVEWIPNYHCSVECAKAVAVFGHRDIQTGQQICVFWDKSAIPTDGNDTVNATLKITGANFNEPVWVDTITGGVYAIPKEQVSTNGNELVFHNIPVYDAPTFITERSLLAIVPSIQ